MHKPTFKCLRSDVIQILYCKYTRKYVLCLLHGCANVPFPLVSKLCNSKLVTAKENLLGFTCNLTYTHITTDNLLCVAGHW